MRDSTLAGVSATRQETCVHCGTPSSLPIYLQGKAFCCSGCKAIYQLLHEQGLNNYYLLREQVGAQAQPVLSADMFQDYQFADQVEFINSYAYGATHNTLDIYVEGVHCAACLWLIEKLPQFVTQVKSARLKMGDNTLTVVIDGGGFASVLSQLNRWGYRPHPLKSGTDVIQWRQREYHRDLSRLAVAAFSAGNIMLISVSLYAGLVGPLARYFEWMSLVLILPSLFYAAIPLYKSSLSSLQQKRISIDLPIVVAMFTALGVSVRGLIVGGATYFDSISALVFLILASRLFLKRLQNHHIDTSRLQTFLELFQVRKWNGSQFVTTLPQTIIAGDRLRVLAGETIPVDGEILSGYGFLNTAMINGESAPTEIRSHQAVLMGSTVSVGWVEIIARVPFHESRVQKLLREIESSVSKTQTLKIADRVGQFFLAIVMSIATVTILIFAMSSNLSEGLHRALSFIIVACPCTFASVLPLVFSLALRRAAKNGIFIKHATVFEKIQSIKNIFFDKTGVLTEGLFDVQNWTWLKTLSNNEMSVLYSVISKSEHPVSRALAEYLQRQKPVLTLEEVSCQNLAGRGWQGVDSQGRKVQVVKAVSGFRESDASISNHIEIWIDQEKVASVKLGDCLRRDSKKVVKQLQIWGYDCFIISGDRTSTVHQVADLVEIPKHQVWGDLSFDDKLQIVKKHSGTMMVGDGNNDSLALKGSDIGIAFHGGVETALKSSDVYFSQGDLSRTLVFMSIAKKAQRLIQISLRVSVFYNLIAGSLALMGYIHPLLAAVIMPINAVTVFLICQWEFREQAFAWK